MPKTVIRIAVYPHPIAPRIDSLVLSRAADFSFATSMAAGCGVQSSPRCRSHISRMARTSWCTDSVRLLGMLGSTILRPSRV